MVSWLGRKRLLQDPRAELAGAFLGAAGDRAGGAVAVGLPTRVGAARAVGGVGAVAVAGGGPAGGVQLADDVRRTLVELAAVQVVVGADVARLLGALALLVVGAKHGGLDDLAAGGV